MRGCVAVPCGIINVAQHSGQRFRDTRSAIECSRRRAAGRKWTRAVRAGPWSTPPAGAGAAASYISRGRLLSPAPPAHLRVLFRAFIPIRRDRSPSRRSRRVPVMPAGTAAGIAGVAKTRAVEPFVRRRRRRSQMRGCVAVPCGIINVAQHSGQRFRDTRSAIECSRRRAAGRKWTRAVRAGPWSTPPAGAGAAASYISRGRSLAQNPPARRRVLFRASILIRRDRGPSRRSRRIPVMPVGTAAGIADEKRGPIAPPGPPPPTSGPLFEADRSRVEGVPTVGVAGSSDAGDTAGGGLAVVRCRKNMVAQISSGSAPSRPSLSKSSSLPQNRRALASTTSRFVSDEPLLMMPVVDGFSDRAKSPRTRPPAPRRASASVRIGSAKCRRDQAVRRTTLRQPTPPPSGNTTSSSSPSKKPSKISKPTSLSARSSTNRKRGSRPTSSSPSWPIAYTSRCSAACMPWRRGLRRAAPSKNSRPSR